MRGLALLLFSIALFAGCEPLSGPAFPPDEDRPCKEDADCEVHAGEAAAHQALCSSRTTAHSDKGRDMDAAACGPMGNMNPKMAEPVLACFRGTCVSVGSKR
jgi:hypothetical protein